MVDPQTSQDDGVGAPVSLCSLVQQSQPVEDVTPQNLKDTIIGLVDCGGVVVCCMGVGVGVWVGALVVV